MKKHAKKNNKRHGKRKMRQQAKSLWIKKNIYRIKEIHKSPFVCIIPIPIITKKIKKDKNRL